MDRMKLSRLPAVFVLSAVLALAACANSATEPSPSPSPSVVAAVLDDRPLEEQLVEAVLASDTALAALAIEAGADPNLFNEESQNSPLSLAITRDDLDMVQLLLDAGAEFEWPELNYSALQMVAPFAGADVTQALLNAGAHPDGVGEQLGIPLASAAFEGNYEVVAVLLNAGANPNVVLDNGQRTFTPLYSAAYSGDLESVRLLIQAGADPSFRSNDGYSAAEWADYNGYPEVAEFLRLAGA